MRLLFHTKPLIAIVCLLFMGLTVSAQNDAALATAQKYLSDNVRELGLAATDISELTVSDNYVSKHNGVTHIYFQQKHAGIDVYNSIFNINILPNGEVLNYGNRFLPDLQKRVNTTSPQLDAADAIQVVIDHFGVKTPSTYELTEIEKNDKGEIIFAHEGIALAPIKAKLVYQPMPNKMVHLAWEVRLYELDAQNWWNARIDALTGKVLAHHNQVIKCDFGSPEAVCAEEHNHHHAHAKHTENAPSMVDVSNGYYILPLTVESPNHGDHELVVGPADPESSPFGWHDVDGAEGHEFTITRGNNVHAYQDINGSNSSSGDEPDGGDSLLFEFPFDGTNIFPQTQVDAATTNLFYWNNLMHDIWYHYGFDEASGNFQQNNYENGGEGGDPVQAECLDGSGTNNANFATDPDGFPGRMQMYYWTTASVESNPLIVNAPSSVAGEYGMQPGTFGGALPPSSDPLTSEVVLADDGNGVTSDACQDIVNGAELNGKIALIDRGDCEFGFKTLAAENAGAIAVIICNNVASPATIAMGAGAVGIQVTIPTVMVSLADCNTIKMGLPGLEVTLGSDIDPANGPPGIDGDFDNVIIAHEYGHGISTRLVGGPSIASCLFNNEQPGEGWSDWFGLALTTTAANNADEGRGIGTYAQNQPTNGPGIRPFPYSRSMAINPFTYADINSGVSVPHGVGSVWCTMIWDLYWNLVDEYGFDDDLYYGTGGNNVAMRLVTEGLKFTACSPSFVDSRDGILAADQAIYDGANTCLIWETFARRGLGANAQAGGIEDFSTDGLALCNNAIDIEKTGTGTAEAGDVITYTLNLTNGTDNDLSNFSITDILPEGTSYVEGSFNCGSASASGNVLTLTMDNFTNNQITPCTYEVVIGAGEYTQFDFSDGMESGLDQWEISNGTSTENWELNANSKSGQFAAFAVNPSAESDQYLTWGEPFLINGDSPIFAFWHSYNTEEDWDGGVVEIRMEGQNTWEDLGDLMTSNGYDGNIEVNPASAISGRPAFHGNSGGYIYTQIDLSSYQGQTVQIRFRFASDGFVGGEGWYVDDVLMYYGELVTIENTACMSNQVGSQICSSAETVVFGSAVSSTDEKEENAYIALYPNPTHGIFSLQMKTDIAQNATLNIYSTDGQLLRSFDFNTNETQRFDLTAYGAGVYLAEIISGEIQTVRKVVVN